MTRTQKAIILFLLMALCVVVALMPCSGQTLVNPYIAKRVESTPPAGGVPAFITNYYDARVGSSITHASNVVSQWNDLRGSNHLTQATAGQRPLWNGSDGVFFAWSTASGNDDRMTGLEPGPYSLPITFYMVLSANGVAAGNGILRAATPATTILSHDAGSSRIQATLGTTGNASYTTNTQVCVVVIYNGTSSTVRINGGTPATFGNSTSSITDLTLGYIGSGTGWTCNAIYRANTVPNSTENGDMEAYITSEFGITF